VEPPRRRAADDSLSTAAQAPTFPAMRRALALIAALLPLPAAAHPHVFIGTGLTLVLDDRNRLAEIRVTWSYDELYSLLVLEERGLDPDYDGILTPDELRELNGFDMAWIEGFPGDTYAAAGGTPLSLGPPTGYETTMEDGRIVTTHTRSVEGAPPAAAVSLKAYDPTFFTAYEISRGVTLEGGSGCEAVIVPANLDAAYTMLEELLYGPRSTEWSEDDFPEVGEAFADEVRLTCASGS
jgi:ABC-type uncharacterized transport system substrate-binding protein